MTTILENEPPQTKCAAAYVLVVDDEEPNRTLLRDPLEARGYEVAEAENGERALQMIRERQPDVVLLDVMMPGFNGFEVCQQIKSDAATAAVPVLMITALSERRERLMGIESGANDFLNKPIDIQDVLLRVGNAAYTTQLFRQLQAERERSERLLLNTLPAPIAQRMKQGEENIVDSFREVTVLQADLVGFSTLCTHINPEEVVWLLNEVFSAFDSLADKRRLEKIKTIGDAYMVVGGIPVSRDDHADAIADLAIDMREEVDRFNGHYNTSFQFRIGVSTGPIIAGVIGKRKFSYDLWGDTVNMACRLEGFAEPGTIQVSETTFLKLKDKFTFGKKQRVSMKSGTEVITYTLCSRA
jgi:class 3 adenylate cyclase